MNGVGIAPVRVGTRTELRPACVRGHRKFMEKMLRQHSWQCPECGWILHHMDWLRYLIGKS